MKRKAKEAPADAADVPVVSPPATEEEDGSSKEASVGRSASGRLAAGRPRAALPAPGDEAAAQDAGGGGGRKRRNTRRKENGTGGLEADAAAGADAGMSPSPWQPGDGAEPDIGSERDISRLGESVVKVFCVHSEPNYSLPWTRKRQFSSTGSGFLLPDRRILTNAHCVDHHSQVKVRRRGSDTKFVATVLAIGTECDIAMLTVKDDTFWQGVEPVRFGTLPHLQDSILVIGYPIGGDSQSVTSGVVSRIEVTSYVHGSTELLGMQIDAAINSGNSGGPAFNHKGECVGIAFQSLKNDEAENIGYVIPPPVIHHFIDDFTANGRYTGFPALGIEWQKLESPALQKALGMKTGQKGVLVRRVEPTCPTSKLLRKGDILLQFDDTEIGVDGTVAFRSGERINFSYLISEKQNNDKAVLKILRGGKVSKVTLQLKGPHRMIPSHIKGAAPSYYVYAGLVFTPVTVPYLKSEYGKEFEFDSPVKILDKLLHSMAESHSQQVVVVGQVLASEINIGFEDIVNTQILRINDAPVSNLRDVVAAIDGCKSDFIRLDLEYDQLVILDTKAGREATPAILEGHGIPFDRSVDLRPDAAAA